MPRKVQRNAADVSPLASFVRQVHDDGWPYGRMAARALEERGIYASDETFRKAANDGFKTQLRPQTVKQLAAGLGVNEQEVRRLDDMNPRWRRSEAAEITERQVVEFLRRSLPEHLAEHIVSQYYILRDAARDGPDPRKGRRRGGDVATTRVPVSPDNVETVKPAK